MKVVIEILTGKLFYIQVEEDATVADLKREIGAQENLPYDRLLLMLGINLMHYNEVSLVEYGVRDGSHLYLFFNSLVVDNSGSSNPSSSASSTDHHLLPTSQDSCFSQTSSPLIRPSIRQSE
ncbi:hypothetical protein DCAR_0522616 [Daucus carota subsp. sativus]|uniref:Ubiquitin-like domain-containing protein n=1 Tax=Daucus carota subsp. sativus TaxID=79200 RepID=A0A162A7E3_DAUCS|nr:hypothetical protein DCAR_0522616 [Daucus carota subsp. sativus]